MSVTKSAGQPPSPWLPRPLAIIWVRVLHFVPTIIGILIVNFFLLQLAPGDAADVLAGEAGVATAETMDAIRERHGLDRSAFGQFLLYVGNLSQGSLGWSIRYDMPVVDLIAQRLPSTILLMISALGLALVIGLVCGVVMACWRGRWPDRLLSMIVLFLYSVPGFWVSLMLIVALSLKLGWFPTGGSGSLGGATLGWWDWLLDRLRHMALPLVSLSLYYIAIYCRLMRAATLESMSADFVKTATAKGLNRWNVITRHVVPNALLPITTMLGVHIGGMLGNAVVIETVFSWPGMGRLAFESLAGRDFNVLLGVLLLSSFIVVFSNMFVDIVQGWLDPRIGDKR